MLTSIRFALSPHHHHQYQYQSKLFFLTLSNRKAFPDVAHLARFAPLRSPPPFLRRLIPRTRARIRTPFALAMASGESSRAEYANRLAQEKSPYLLQHAHNPVNWYPWGEEAFLKAKEEDKPIFLSVGYSTCHWCHVMEVESFENEEVAKLLNDSFVSIKVDREERPDVDKVYMTYVQATQGGGGWPMSVFLTPELKPFLGGTYFPPDDKYGRSGFKSILRRVKEVWDVKKDSIRLSGEQVIQQLVEATAASARSTEIIEGLAEKAIELCAEELMGRYDEEYGGFGSAPKFPRPVEINLMFWHYKCLKLAGKEDTASKALTMALHTLRSMARGGVHDHVGGGFHRYSVDEYWHVPHFEKMLYDQGQLVSVYLDAFAISKEVIFACVARDVIDYLMREMLHAEGGIFSAEDADSAEMEGSTKKEGAFYVWSSQEIVDVLGKDKSELFLWHYYIKPGGNCDLSSLSDPHNEFVGKNVLMELKGLEKTVSKFGIPRDEVLKILGLCRRELFEARVKRPHPHLDDKVIVAWNGLAISAFAKASQILKTGPYQPAFHFPVTGCDASEYFGVAERAANFVKSQIYDESSRRLQRSFREGPSQAPGFLDDYAYLIAGLLDLYEAGGNTKWLSWACELQEIQDNLFLDPVGGGYFSTPEGDPSILIRMKDDYDGAEPSGNSVAAMNLLRLSSLVSGDQSNDYHRIAEHLLAVFEERVKNLPLAVPLLCCAMDLIAQPEKRQVVVAGPKQTPAFDALLTSCHASFDPSKVIIHVDPSDPEDVKFWELRNPMVLAMAQKSSGSEAIAYVCQNFTCQAPIRDPLALQQLLEQPPSSPKVTTFNIKSIIKP